MSDLSNSDNTTGEIRMEKSLREKKRDISTVDGLENHHRESRVSVERERRKKIRLFMRELQNFVPSLHTKADQATIVEETMKYIKTLEENVEKLEKLKREGLQSASNFANNPTESSSSMDTQDPIGFQTWNFPNVVVSICGEEAQFSMCFPKKEGLFCDICGVLEKHNINVLSANISSDNRKSSYMIQAHANKQNSDQAAVEETFKEAAREIHLLSPI